MTEPQKEYIITEEQLQQFVKLLFDDYYENPAHVLIDEIRSRQYTSADKMLEELKEHIKVHNDDYSLHGYAELLEKIREFRERER